MNNEQHSRPPKSRLRNNILILNIFYGLILVLFLLDNLNEFDIKIQWIKSCIYFGFLIGTPFVLIYNALVVRKKIIRLVVLIFPIIILLYTLSQGPMKVVFSTGAWHTQVVLYQNEHSSYQRIEYQVQDLGALGYKKRVVKVTYLTPLFMITDKVPEHIDQLTEWTRVDKHPNELELNYP